jgi:hypothetical protein
MVTSDCFKKDLESKAEEPVESNEPVIESYYYGVVRYSYNIDLTNERSSHDYPIVISEKPEELLKRCRNSVNKDQMFSNKEIAQIGPFAPIAKGSYDMYKLDAKELMEKRDEEKKNPIKYREYENNLLKVVANGYTSLPLLDRDQIKFK